MKKLILSLIAVAVGTLSSFAQSDLVATLSHGSSLSTFIGVDALSEAYTAAVEGDVITLSSGTFNAVTMEKSLTIRGTGMHGLSNGIEPTMIVGDLSLKIPDDNHETPVFEGICFKNYVHINSTNVAPINIFKCKFLKKFTCFGINANFVHCIIENGISCTNGNVTTRMNFVNSVIESPSSEGELSTMNINNCVIINTLEHICNSSLRNCILVTRTGFGDHYLPNSSTANNCVAIEVNEGRKTTFSEVSGSNNSYAVNMESLFKTFGNYYYQGHCWIAGITNLETFELTETAAATYLGDDGTQVGIYGGTNPFNPTPSNPQVKKFTVNSTTVGDQLKVKINVE